MARRASTPRRTTTTKRKGAPAREAQGRIQTKRSRSAYARRIDERISGEIEKAVTVASHLRDQIVEKIERGLKAGKERAGGASPRRRRQ